MKSVRRRCAALPLDLIEPISSRLLSDDVVDYISFRAVCRDWRSRTASPRSFAYLFRPHRWIMLSDSDGDRSAAPRRFLNLSTGRSLLVPLPELETHSVFSVYDGLLVLLEEHTSTMRLLNPFTRHLSADFPPLSDNFLIRRSTKCSLTSSDCPNLMLYFCKVFDSYRCSAKPGETSWEVTRFTSDCISPIFFKGKFYCISRVKGICLIEPPEQELVTLVSMDYIPGVFPSNLFKFGSDLLLLVCKNGELVAEKFEIFRVDLESNNLIKLENLGEYALFIGLNKQTVLASSKNLPSIKGNSIYYHRNQQLHCPVAIYNIYDKSCELFSTKHSSIRPLTLADHLLMYCLML